MPSTSNCNVILEDETGLCGYVFALADAKSLMTKAQVLNSQTQITGHIQLLFLTFMSVCFLQVSRSDAA